MIKYLILLNFIFLSLRLSAQDSISCDTDSIIFDQEIQLEEIPEQTVEEEAEEITITLPDYIPWDKIKMDGKLKMQGLPLSPSLKIFMQKDSIIDISIRAPFVGEAGRMVVTPDSVVLINKMNKTFVNEKIADFLKYYPGGISDMQDLLLARVFIPGYNLYDTDIEDLVDIFYEESQFNVMPKESAKIPGITYGYAVDETFQPLWLLILPESRPDLEIDAQYIYNLQGYNLILDYIEGDKKRELTLELKNPESTREEPKSIEINKKFRQLSFNDFLRTF